ncbi:c-type cytochrome [sulfur-oxidizing endosymbiont of Gigantopelta aegis]|uniref:c-type cytochrome n=1 Tax=sulfur-oxidizing endosymbiont of Gigantopelta aegis TaxID=2794934 RepID=UPI001FED220B|nr:c-type cytochrome [sulfur-oxidizing endosymbiont of Gigantopelta aegis]
MKKLTQLTVAAMCFAGISYTSNVMALDGGALYLDATKGGCSACHGKDAKTPMMATFPKLAGQNADYAYNQMKDIQSGARANGQTAMMKGIIHMTTDEEKKAIAKWLSEQ